MNKGLNPYNINNSNYNIKPNQIYKKVENKPINKI